VISSPNRRAAHRLPPRAKTCNSENSMMFGYFMSKVGCLDARRHDKYDFTKMDLRWRLVT
jgi:hypothetical protein